MASTLGILIESETFGLCLDAMDMAAEGLRYMSNFDWFKGATGMVWATGVPGVVGIFHLSLSKKMWDRESLWVVVGDLPTAYLVKNTDESAIHALENYASLMDDWCTAVEAKTDLCDVYPVAAPATLENAQHLRSRMNNLREILPSLELSGVGKRVEDKLA